MAGESIAGIPTPVDGTPFEAEVGGGAAILRESAKAINEAVV